MSKGKRNGMDRDMKVALILRGAIAVVVGSVVTILMFTRLTRSALLVSYNLGQIDLDSAPTALFDEIVFSVLIGIAAGVIALILIYSWTRMGRGKEP